MVVAAPNKVSRILGKLEVRRQFTVSLVCWPRAGAATPMVAIDAATGPNCRRVTDIGLPPVLLCWRNTMPVALVPLPENTCQLALQPPSIGIAAPVISTPAGQHRQ